MLSTAGPIGVLQLQQSYSAATPVQITAPAISHIFVEGQFQANMTIGRAGSARFGLTRSPAERGRWPAPSEPSAATAMASFP